MASIRQTRNGHEVVTVENNITSLAIFGHGNNVVSIVISGVISVIKKLDRESKPNGYSLAVVARDHGYPIARYSTVLVNVTISDINDNSPQFDKFTYSGMIREDASLSDVVTRVRASDEDQGLSGDIIYSITSNLYTTSTNRGLASR